MTGPTISGAPPTIAKAFRAGRTDPALRTPHFALAKCGVPRRPRTDPALRFFGRMGPSRAAASGGIAADGSGSEDGEAGDPEFDLLPGEQKRKILQQRKMAADKAPTAKKARGGDAGDAGDVEDDHVVVIIGRAQAAAAAYFNAQTCANAGAAETDGADAASPTIAQRNSREPRDRAFSPAEQRVRDAVKDAARVQREKEQRRKRKGGLFEGIAEEPPQTPMETEHEEQSDADGADADAEVDIDDEEDEEQDPPAESPEATG